MRKTVWLLYEEVDKIFLEDIFLQLRKPFSKFLYQVIVIVLYDIIGLQNLSLSFCQS